MSDLTIRTNNHWREPVSFYEMPKVAREQFDYVDNDSDRYGPRFFEYRGCWYDTGEFFRIHAMSSSDPHAMRAPEDSPFHAWTGYQSDSFFSGVLIRYSEDFESIQVATYCQ